MEDEKTGVSVEGEIVAGATQSETSTSLTTLVAMPLLEKACRCKRRQRMSTTLTEITITCLLVPLVLGGRVSILGLYGWFIGAMSVGVALSIGMYCIPVKNPQAYLTKLLQRNNTYYGRMNPERRDKIVKRLQKKGANGLSTILCAIFLGVFLYGMFTAFFNIGYFFKNSPTAVPQTVLVGVSGALFIVAQMMTMQAGDLLQTDPRFVDIYVHPDRPFDMAKATEEWENYKKCGYSSIFAELRGMTPIKAVASLLILVAVGISIAYPFTVTPFSATYAAGIPVGIEVGHGGKTAATHWYDPTDWATQEGMEIYLGKPDAVEGNTWMYFSSKYRRAYKRAEKLAEEIKELMENNGSADTFDKKVMELAELWEQMKTMVHKRLAVQFTDKNFTEVAQVGLDTQYLATSKQKTLKKVTCIGDMTVRDGEDLSTKVVYAQVYWADGSYFYVAVPNYVFTSVDRTQKGAQTSVWHTDYGDIDLTVTVL